MIKGWHDHSWQRHTECKIQLNNVLYGLHKLLLTQPYQTTVRRSKQSKTKRIPFFKFRYIHTYILHPYIHIHTYLQVHRILLFTYIVVHSLLSTTLRLCREAHLSRPAPVSEAV